MRILRNRGVEIPLKFEVCCVGSLGSREFQISEVFAIVTCFKMETV